MSKWEHQRAVKVGQIHAHMFACMDRDFHTGHWQKRHQITAVAIADAANFIFFKGAVFGEEKMLSIMPILRVLESQVSNREHSHAHAKMN